MFHLQAFLLIVIIFALVSVITADESSPVTCGSGIKLIHKETKFHLHSHAIAWGSGSGQQSVTASGTQADPNSIWVVKEPIKISQTCELSKPILCGSMISLEHAGTGKYYHKYMKLIVDLCTNSIIYLLDE